MRLSWVFLYGSLAYGVGIFFASFFFSSLYPVLFLLWVGVILLSVFWGLPKPMLAGLCCFAMALGFAAYHTSSLLPSTVERKENSFVGVVVQPVERDERTARVVVSSPDIEGRVLLFASLFENIRQGDRIQVSGELELPVVFEGFNYPLFLKKEGILQIVRYPLIEVLESAGSPLSKLRERFLSSIASYLSPPESSLLSAMLLGDSRQLPEEFAQALSRTGTRHITAVSGMHVAILSGMLLVFLLGLGFERRTSSVMALLFLLFFIMLVGAPASALRAGLMGSTMLVGGIVGRRSVSLRALVFAAFIMLVFNPLLLAYDIGFQLSFLAVFSILLFAPVLQYALKKFPNPAGLRDLLSVSIAAQILPLPLVLYHFNILSLVSLFSNLLVVPLLPAVLLLGAVFLSVSFLPLLAGVAAFLVGLPLSYIAFIVEQFAKFPFATAEVSGVFLWISFLVLLVPSLLAFRFQQSRRFRFQEQIVIL